MSNIENFRVNFLLTTLSQK